MESIGNGESRQVKTSATLSQLVAEMGFGGKRVAAEVNLEIVPRSQHDSHRLQPGDLVEIVVAIGGG